MEKTKMNEDLGKEEEEIGKEEAGMRKGATSKAATAARGLYTWFVRAIFGRKWRTKRCC